MRRSGLSCCRVSQDPDCQLRSGVSPSTSPTHLPKTLPAAAVLDQPKAERMLCCAGGPQDLGGATSWCYAASTLRAQGLGWPGAGADGTAGPTLLSVSILFLFLFVFIFFF